MACEDLARKALEPCPFVRVPRSKLREARDLLKEKIRGSNARSPNHNARLVIDELLDSTAYDAIGSGVKSLEWSEAGGATALGLSYDVWLTKDAAQGSREIWLAALMQGERERIGTFSSKEKARAACQADFERRVLSCLSTHTAAGAGPVGEVVAALAEKYCEGFCKGSGRPGVFDDCTGCEIAKLSAARHAEEPGETLADAGDQEETIERNPNSVAAWRREAERLAVKCSDLETAIAVGRSQIQSRENGLVQARDQALTERGGRWFPHNEAPRGSYACLLRLNESAQITVAWMPAQGRPSLPDAIVMPFRMPGDARPVEEPGEVERLRAEAHNAHLAVKEERALADAAEASLAETRERLEKQEEHTFRIVAENDKLRELADAAEELLTVSDLRGETAYIDPCDDPGLWTARRNDAWSALEEAVIARAALTGDAQEAGK